MDTVIIYFIYKQIQASTFTHMQLKVSAWVPCCCRLYYIKRHH